MRFGRIQSFFVVSFFGLILCSTVFAAVPQTINYQGYLTDSGGAPANGTVSMTFSFYSADTGGTALWTETKNIPVSSGVYSTLLGSVVPIALSFDTQYYLGVAVGADAEMTPRQALATSGYAFRAKEADTVAAGGITDAEISVSAAIQFSKISGLGALAAKDTISNGDIDAAAGIQDSKLATISTAGKVSDTALSSNVALLNNSQTLSGTKTFSSPIISSVSTGAAPFQVSSTTTVTNLSADYLDGLDSSSFQRKYGKVAVVARSGGDYIDPGTAMTNIASWCGTPSSTNPCLLKIMPGIYDLGANSLVMQEYVDIEGSGEKTTKITAAVSSGVSPGMGTVNGANNTELRFITVENTGTGYYTAAIVNSSASPSITHVTASVSGGTQRYGIFNSSSSPTMLNAASIASGGTSNFGVYNGSSSPTMINVTTTASGGTYNYGVYNVNSSSPTMTGVAATASGGSFSCGVWSNVSSPTMTSVTVAASGGTVSYGVFNSTSGTTKIDYSAITGTTYAIRNDTGTTVFVGNSKLSGGVSNNFGVSLTCVGAYSGSYAALGSNCQ